MEAGKSEGGVAVNPSLVLHKDLVTLRRLTYAVMLHRGMSKIKAARAVEDIANADHYGADVYSIQGTTVIKIEGEDRWEVGCNFQNEQGMNMFGEPHGPEFWINHERAENAAIDGVGIERNLASRLAGFQSVEELDCYVEKGVSEMRKDQLLAAYGAIEYLIESMREITAPENQPLHYTGLMKIAIEAQREYWADDSAAPKQEAIVREVMEKYNLSGAEAKAVERVACPIDRSKKNSE